MTDGRRNADRWKELSGLFAKARVLDHEDAFTTGRVAHHLRTALAASSGCDLDRVHHYNILLGDIPDYDQSKKVSSPDEAVTKSATGWVTGLGIELEMGPDSYPRIVVVSHLELTFDRKAKSVLIRSPILSGEEILEHASYDADFARIGERLFEGLRDALRKWSEAGSSGKVGFVNDD